MTLREASREFAEAQADTYFEALFSRFEKIAEKPLRYPLVDHIKGGYRRSPCSSDNIYYHIGNNSVEIINIIIK